MRSGELQALARQWSSSLSALDYPGVRPGSQRRRQDLPRRHGRARRGEPGGPARGDAGPGRRERQRQDHSSPPVQPHGRSVRGRGPGGGPARVRARSHRPAEEDRLRPPGRRAHPPLAGGAQRRPGPPSPGLGRGSPQGAGPGDAGAGRALPRRPRPPLPRRALRRTAPARRPRPSPRRRSARSSSWTSPSEPSTPSPAWSFTGSSWS